MKVNNLLRILFLASAIIQFGACTPVIGNTFKDNVALKSSERVTRGAGEEDSIAIDLEKYVATVPIESFDGDYFLIQFLDILNGITTFRHVDPLRQEYAVYNVQYIDGKTPTQDIFVLRKHEDRIKIIKQKRTYVILRRCPKDKRFFYVSLIYLKDASGIPGVKAVDLGGQKFEVEWDIWDHRGGNEYKAQLFGQINCEASIFVSCHNDDTKDFQSNLKLHPKEKPAGLNFVAGKINAEDAEEDADLFYDLDDDVESSRFVGLEIDNLTRSSDSKSKGTGRAASPTDFIGKILNLGMGIVGKFVEIGFGLAKDFGGLFGGLGTDGAAPLTVFTSLEFFNLDIFEDRIPENIFAQITAAIKIPSSGGLGGFFNKDENKEKPETVSAQEFEKDSGDPTGRGFLDFLPEKMKDPMPENVVKKVVQFAIIDSIDTFKHPGWKTLGKKLESGTTLDHENDPFVGFGACNYSEVIQDKTGAAKSAEQLSKVLQLATGTHCIQSKNDELNSLIKNGILKLSDHQTLQISDDIPHVSDDKLNRNATAMLSKAYELAVFSEIYFAELNAPKKDFQTPDGSKISHSVYTLGKYTKSSLLSIKQYHRSHCVKISRNLVKTLKTFILKLLEDKIILDDCESCRNDKEVNYNDSVYLMGLSQFILKGLGPFRKGKDIHDSFDEFFNRNKQVLEGKIKSYCT